MKTFITAMMALACVLAFGGCMETVGPPPADGSGSKTTTADPGAGSINEDSKPKYNKITIKPGTLTQSKDSSSPSGKVGATVVSEDDLWSPARFETPYGDDVVKLKITKGATEGMQLSPVTIGNHGTAEMPDFSNFRLLHNAQESPLTLPGMELPPGETCGQIEVSENGPYRPVHGGSFSRSVDGRFAAKIFQAGPHLLVELRDCNGVPFKVLWVRDP